MKLETKLIITCMSIVAMNSTVIAALYLSNSVDYSNPLCIAAIIANVIPIIMGTTFSLLLGLQIIHLKD